MFDGYRNTLIDIVHNAPGKLLKKLKVNMPFDRFGYMYSVSNFHSFIGIFKNLANYFTFNSTQRNESEDWLGHFNVNTGQDDISKLGITRTWNYQRASPDFESPCNNIRGSSGELFPPWQTKDQSIAIFNGDLCRYIDLYFDKELKINGINAYKYVSTDRSLDNGTKFSENICFGNGLNLPSGVSDISGCRYGV